MLDYLRTGKTPTDPATCSNRSRSNSRQTASGAGGFSSPQSWTVRASCKRQSSTPSIRGVPAHRSSLAQSRGPLIYPLTNVSFGFDLRFGRRPRSSHSTASNTERQ
jgi:hypothetical protein